MRVIQRAPWMAAQNERAAIKIPTYKSPVETRQSSTKMTAAVDFLESCLLIPRIGDYKNKNSGNHLIRGHPWFWSV